MGCAENQESKSTAPDSALSSLLIPSVEDCIWVSANSPHSTFPVRSLCVGTSASCKMLMEFSEAESHALPISQQISAEKSDLLDVHAFCQSYVSDQTATAHGTNTCAMQFGCSPPSGSPGVHSKMHAKLRVPSLCSSPTMVSSSWSGNAAAHALPWSSSAVLLPASSAAKASPSRNEFMHSFVNILLPELQRIHNQSSPISLQEKFSAVRLAADMSLAISAGSNKAWNQALFEELSISYCSKVGVSKNKVRNSSSLRGRIYASILRRNSFRAGSHAMRVQLRPHNRKGIRSLAFASVSRSRPHASVRPSAKVSHASLSGSGIFESLTRGSSRAMRCRKSPYVHRMRRIVSKKHCGLFSYVKIVRNTRSTEKSWGVKSSADTCSEASKAHTPASLSKEHVARLGGLVPGGCNMDVPLLFQEAADYIRSLQMQVEGLKILFHSVSL